MRLANTTSIALLTLTLAARCSVDSIGDSGGWGSTDRTKDESGTSEGESGDEKEPTANEEWPRDS